MWLLGLWFTGTVGGGWVNGLDLDFIILHCQ